MNARKTRQHIAPIKKKWAVEQVAAGRTQVEVAQELGVESSSVSKWCAAEQASKLGKDLGQQTLRERIRYLEAENRMLLKICSNIALARAQ